MKNKALLKSSRQYTVSYCSAFQLLWSKSVCRVALLTVNVKGFNKASEISDKYRNRAVEPKSRRMVRNYPSKLEHYTSAGCTVGIPASSTRMKAKDEASTDEE